MGNFEISVWKDIYDSKYDENRRVITIPEFFEIIRGNGNEYRVIIERIREETDKERRSELKKLLPSVTVSGTFRERRLNALIKHSGFICIDFDNIGTRLDSIRESLNEDRNIAGYFLSASATGLAIIVKIEGHRHEESFEAIERYFFEKYSLVADAGCKDICRLRFFSYDPKAYTNFQSELFNKFPKIDKKPKKHYVEVPCTKGDIGRIVSQITQKQLDVTDGSYSEWQRLAASLATLGEAGRDYFHATSQYHPKYDFNQANKKFDNLLNTANGNITIGTFYYFAKRSGLNINKEKAAEIVRICKETKKVSKLTVENAIERLKQKKIIGIEENLQENKEDVELVKKVYESVDVGEVTGIQEIEDYIFETWDIRRNEITSALESKNGNNALEDKDYSEIYLECKKLYPKVSKNDVVDILQAKAAEYNPIKDFIAVNRNLIAEGKTEGLIERLAATITSDTGLDVDSFDATYEYYFIKKWYIGMIASLYGHVSPLLLALTGPQRSGKTEWFRRLMPGELERYSVQMKLSADRDCAANMCKFLLILDDELSGKSKIEEKHFNELTSTKYFTYRPPFGKTSITRKRLAVLCGTTNNEAVLSDPTGNRRIIPIKVLSINHDLYNGIDKKALFMEAVRLYEFGESWELTSDDVERLEKNTVQHVSENYERELLLRYFDVPFSSESESFAKFFTTSAIKDMIESKIKDKISIKKLGVELRMIKAKRVGRKRKSGNSEYGYLLIQKSKIDYDLDMDN